ncbi:branched-chain amino acid ABC transporter permease [Haloferacaceae archaeon DSL9]
MVVADVLVGLSIGSRLFLIAVGLSLIFGVLNVLNFAHGVFYMVGAYVAISVAGSVVGNFWLAIVVSGLAVGAIGAAVEMGFIRRLYDRADGELDQLILTFAFVLIIHDAVRLVWGGDSYSLATPALFDFRMSVLGESFLAYRLFVILASVIIMLVLWTFLQRTYYGHLIRATSSDREMASMLGVDVSRLYTGVFFLGSMLAGIGGALAAPLQAVTPGLGDQVIIDAFVVVVIGGLGSLGGAFAGAMIIGLLQSFGVSFISGGDLALPFIAMILVLIFRPEGLFGGVEQ